MVWVRNDQWQQSTDKIRTPKVDKITLSINTNANDNDQQLQAGTADATADGGVNVPFQTKIATDPSLKKNADDPVSSYVRYFAVFQQVKPLDNVHCRRAIFYAINKSDLLRARGGSLGGQIANTGTQPTVPGFDANANPYPDGPDNTGDLAKAKDELQQCGQPERLLHQGGLRQLGSWPGRVQREPAGAGPGRHQGDRRCARAVRLLRWLHRQAGDREERGHRHRAGRLGC